MKKVFISGAFNVLHPGHLRLIKFAKDHGDKLIVGVYSDKIAGASAHVSEKLRLVGIKNNKLVDQVILIKSSLKKTILKIKPNIIVKGKEHEQKYNEEEAIIKKIKGKLIFSSGDTIFSSIDLIRKEVEVVDKGILEKVKDYLKRNKLNINEIIHSIKRFKNLKVCVVGDLILDKYIYCDPIGMSQEDHSIVATPIDEEIFLGGASIVAAHAAGMGANTHYLSVSGKDKMRKLALNLLNRYGVKSEIIEDSTRSTTVKNRYISDNNTLFRLTEINQENISKKLEVKILNKFKRIVKKIDLLIFSDFNYGVLTNSLILQLIKIAKANNVIVSADCQSSSQIGDISKYKNLDLITPTEREARISTKNFKDGLIVMIESLRKLSGASNILLKLGSDGIIIHSATNKSKFKNDRLPSLNVKPISVSGAGDSMLVGASLSLALKNDKKIWLAALIGSLFSAIQVSRLGNIPVKAKELIETIKKV